MATATTRRLGLSVDGADVLRYNDDGASHPRLSPRPYLHPLRTLAGTMVSDAFSPDHPHHLGLSMAVSDLDGINFWGGRTYTPDGSKWLPNHGRQVSMELGLQGRNISEMLSWRSPDGTEVAVESRKVGARSHPAPGCWALSLTSTLQPAPDRGPITISSSGVKGRPGAGYGGIFWRFPRDARVGIVQAGGLRGVQEVHGARTPWLSLSVNVSGVPATVILLQDIAHQRPWFVRTEGYIGAGPAAAWDSPLHVTGEHPLRQSIRAVVCDGVVDSPELADFLAESIPSNL